MDAVPGYGRMFGGLAPSQIFKDFMTSATKGTNCSDWGQPKTPFQAQPFFGALSKSPPAGGPSSTSPGDQSQYYAPGLQPRSQPAAPAATAAPAADTTPAPAAPAPEADGGGDDAAFPPGQYESPPQGTPAGGDASGGAGPG